MNGERALEAVDLNPPDIILLDIMMPGINGYEVCEHLKQNPHTKDIPVIFLSALDESLNKVRAFSVGGVDYITKPYNADEVLARVRTHLSLRKLQVRLEETNAKLASTESRTTRGAGRIQTLSGLIPICAWCGRKIQTTMGNGPPLKSTSKRTPKPPSHTASARSAYQNLNQEVDREQISNVKNHAEQKPSSIQRPSSLSAPTTTRANPT